MQRDPQKFTPPGLVNSVCTECSATVPEEFSSCDDFFRSASVNLWILPMRICVDAFALQHPKRACKSAKSYAAHLTGLCCALEYDGAQSVYTATQKWLNGSAERIGIVRPKEPEFRGKLTLRFVYDAETQAEILSRTQAWAKDVWNAYSSQHTIAREWMGESFKMR